MITNKMYLVQLKMREARFWPAPLLRGKDKKFQFALKIGWRALAEGEPENSFTTWRWGQDSNLRGLTPTRFPIVLLKPLGHPTLLVYYINIILKVSVFLVLFLLLLVVKIPYRL